MDETTNGDSGAAGSVKGLSPAVLGERIEAASIRASRASDRRYAEGVSREDARAAALEEKDADAEITACREELRSQDYDARVAKAITAARTEVEGRTVSTDEAEARAVSDGFVFDRLVRACLDEGKSFDKVFAATWADGGSPLPGLDGDETRAIFARWSPVAGAMEKPATFAEKAKAVAAARGITFEPTARGVRRVAYGLDSGTGGTDTAAGTPTINSPLVPSSMSAEIIINDPRAGGIFQPASTVRVGSSVVIGERLYPQFEDDGSAAPRLKEGADAGTGDDSPKVVRAYSHRAGDKATDLTRELLEGSPGDVVMSLLTLKRRRAQRRVGIDAFMGAGATTGERTPRGFLPLLPSQEIPNTIGTRSQDLKVVNLEAALSVVQPGAESKNWFATRSFISVLRSLTEESARVQLLRYETGIAGPFATTMFGYPVVQATDEELNPWLASSNDGMTVAAFGSFDDCRVEMSPVPHLNIFTGEQAHAQKNSVGVFYSLWYSAVWLAATDDVGLTPAVKLITATG